MGKFKRVCVFCGSNSGHRKIFSDAALQLGTQLVERKMDLVYGGGSVGLMGLVSQTVYDGGCHVLGVIPTALVPLEVGLLNIDGYYDCLLRLFDKGVEEGFINLSARNIVISAKTAQELIQRMEEYIPLHNQVAPTQSWNVEENHANHKRA
ncbi:hypothetical protein PRUPE_6G005100 [Prunus persica]|uniref:cytokinin riboside 5'-monophosphate phosphoribohydrolase n=1 Tax=Prunus persica TaxID=3760 RepID=A0A251NI81_PRUPE|nr:hypothetical protein PRUPE_6G005100 [Prunus persica]